MAKSCSDDSMEYNEKQCKSAAQRINKIDARATDYSLKSKDASGKEME